MPASTTQRILLLAAAILSAIPTNAIAENAEIRVRSTSTQSGLSSVADGIAEILANELRRSGWFGEIYLSDKAQDDSTDLTPGMTILVNLGDFGGAERASGGADLSDLMRLAGKGRKVAHTSFQLVLSEPGGTSIYEAICEGVESRHGKALPSENSAYYAGVNFLSDDFRLSMEGRATYKAIGAALEGLYAALPQRGEVLAVSGDAVVVSLGSDGLVEVGDRLSIYRDQGISNGAGTVVWPNLRLIGSAEVVELRPKSCLCLILDGAFDLAEGDVVKPQVSREMFPDEALPDQ
jgi:hypothetical protein